MSRPPLLLTRLSTSTGDCCLFDGDEMHRVELLVNIDVDRAMYFVASSPCPALAAFARHC